MITQSFTASNQLSSKKRPPFKIKDKVKPEEKFFQIPITIPQLILQPVAEQHDSFGFHQGVIDDNSQQLKQRRLSKSNSKAPGIQEMDMSTIDKLNNTHKKLIEEIMTRNSKKRNSTQLIETSMMFSNPEAIDKQQTLMTQRTVPRQIDQVNRTLNFQNSYANTTIKTKHEELVSKSASRNQKFILKDLTQLYEKTQMRNKSNHSTSQSPQNLMKHVQMLNDHNYQNYKGQSKIVDEKFKQFFHLNASEQDQFMQNQKTQSQQKLPNQFSTDLQQLLEPLNSNSTSRQVRPAAYLPSAQNSRQRYFQKQPKRLAATSQIQHRNRLQPRDKTIERKIYDPEYLEKDDSLKKRNIKFYEDLINQNFQKPSLTTRKGYQQTSSIQAPVKTEFQDENLKQLIDDYGGLFFLQKNTQKILEKQLVRLGKFSIDFQITKNTISESMKTFFTQKQDQPEQEQEEDSSFDSQDSFQQKKIQKKQLNFNYQKFEQLKKKVEGLTFPLVSYAKDIEKGTTAMKQEESLKKRTGLMDFLSEMNDCQKNLLRFLMETSPNNSPAMYCLDFLWKMILIRFEYHLDDEEQRIMKVQKYYEQQLKKETTEISQTLKNKEDQYKQTIYKLEKLREDLVGRVEKLTVDKTNLLDTIQDKEDELRIMRDPQAVNRFGNMHTELDIFMKDMNSNRKEQSLAVKGLKVFMDQIATQRSPAASFMMKSINQEVIRRHSAAFENESSILQLNKLQSQSSNTSEDESIKKLKVLVTQADPTKSQREESSSSSEGEKQENLVKLNKSKSRPSYRITDEGLLTPQIAQHNNQKLKNKAMLYQQQQLVSNSPGRISQVQQSQQQQQQSQISVQIKRTKDQQLQTDEDIDFICSKCLIKAQLEEEQISQAIESRENNNKEEGGGSKDGIEVRERAQSIPKKEEILKLQKVTTYKKQIQRRVNISEKGNSNSIILGNNQAPLFQEQIGMQSRQVNFAPNKNTVALVDLLDANSKEIVIMPEQTLIKHVEEVLEKKFESDEKSTQQIKASNTSPISQMQAFQINYTPQDILSFTYNHFLAQQGLKSLSIRYINSIFSGLKKIYLKSPQDNLYAQFLIQIFGFCPEDFPAFRPDQARVALKVRHLFQIVQKHQNMKHFKMKINKISTRLADGGVINLAELIPFLFKSCKSQSKGLFSNFINKLQVNELIYPENFTPQQIQKHFISFKILSLISFSKIDLHTLAMRTEGRELQMDSVIMRLEEILEFKISHQELSIFKKEFDNFFLVPLKTIEKKISSYIGEDRIPGLDFEISLLILMNKVLEEWESYQNQQRKKLLKKFIDFDENGDGVLTLDEFRELMRHIEGSNIPSERVITLFTEALELSSQEQNDEGSAFSDKLSPQCFVETMMRNRIGGYGTDFMDFDFMIDKRKHTEFPQDKVNTFTLLAAEQQ